MQRTILTRIMTWCVVCMTALMAINAQAAQDSPETLIRDNAKALMSKLEGRQQYYRQHEDELKQLVDSTVSPIVDFNYVGASVMGKYFRAATPEQRSKFAGVFKKTLLDTYAKGLVTFNYKTLEVPENQDTQRYENQANVDMKVVAESGEVYPVSYTLKQRSGEWRVVNVVVNGINLGLTFRNQFDQAMRDNNRDIDAVIAGWAPEVDLEKGDQKANG
ncbi:MlaC/ttg2D family ABC transporter substrate-binding protein [Larsenimonas rhizosphaerae]|uniref:MlaC/ttg2D family ABC transporter substrate-binding protein n=1 Tax=Larsenimonas rhizosphaerae TaxID=2944682 RepID=UPI002033346B|nr:ABC transporter substrate-binding protein [Larsenimonas rhizosphaerae]MCM2131071.1 ABC transporter substrate-binding protein [Larsenimonas rhizosphaerae]